LGRREIIRLILESGRFVEAAKLIYEPFAGVRRLLLAI
jgi:hypothetical protein